MNTIPPVIEILILAVIGAIAALANAVVSRNIPTTSRETAGACIMGFFTGGLYRAMLEPLMYKAAGASGIMLPELVGNDAAVLVIRILLVGMLIYVFGDLITNFVPGKLAALVPKKPMDSTKIVPLILLALAGCATLPGDPSRMTAEQIREAVKDRNATVGCATTNTPYKINTVLLNLDRGVLQIGKLTVGSDCSIIIENAPKYPAPPER